MEPLSPMRGGVVARFELALPSELADSGPARISCGAADDRMRIPVRLSIPPSANLADATVSLVEQSGPSATADDAAVLWRSGTFSLAGPYDRVLVIEPALSVAQNQAALTRPLALQLVIDNLPVATLSFATDC